VANIVADVLHIMLRVVPALYKATVSRHLDKPELESLSQLLKDIYQVVVSSDTAVQSATGKQGFIGNESWPGETCHVILDNYDDILHDVHSSPNNLEVAMATWEAFIIFNEELLNGCDDDDSLECRQAHSRRLRAMAEEFVNKYKVAAGTGSRCTPYMHIMMVDVPEMALRWGSLVKFSSQGVERLHQWVHFITQHRCNRRHDKTAATVLKKLTLKSNQKSSKTKGKKKLNVAGGHRSKIKKAHHQNKISKVRDRVAQRAAASASDIAI
jgi:hypothetical protein